ncbi:MAG: hypothetical protein HYV77_01270 [Candidatus Wildermuthbacteria bacterium]|nr:hypothetical protein [Candidatus Wildermuthbacteria bacterium]
MLYSYNWLKDYIKENLSAPKKLETLLAMHAFEVEEVTRAGKDWIFDISVLPNRAHDTWNHLGMAREVAAITGQTLVEPEKSTLTVKRGTLKPLQTTITAKELVTRYAALVIEGIKVRESPKWLKDRLEAVGINSINTIVDVTNYVMLEIGQPMHAFDYDKIQGHKMLVRKAVKGEELVVLDDSKLSLPEGALVIEDANGLIDLAGIKGGKVSGISEETKNIVLQAAAFDSENIYRTKKQLDYRTQAADMYAAGLDPNIAETGLKRAWYLIQQLGGGTLTQIIDIYPKKTRPTVISLDLE